MVFLPTSDEWQRQSSLLLQARPTTTRVTTKYNIPKLDSPRYQKSNKRKRESEVNGKDAADSGPKAPRASLILKTYDPQSGVCLKFKTDRAAEVGRLIVGLGRLGRHMAALPEQTEDITMSDMNGSGKDTSQGPNGTAPTTTTISASKPEAAPTGGASKKKKKNKK